MASDLSPQNELYLQQAVASGLYPSREAALDAAVESLREQQSTVPFVRDDHASLVDAGLEQIRLGLSTPWNIDEAKAQLQRDLAERRSSGM